MKLSQSEIRNNAIRFASEWKEAASEQAEAQSFWIDIFAVFSIKQRSVSCFEEKVKNIKGAYNRIDVFYAGVMLGEHKSKGEDLTKAKSQAFDYIQDLTRNGRTDEIPQYIVFSDFDNIVVFDLDRDDPGTPTAHCPNQGKTHTKEVMMAKHPFADIPRHKRFDADLRDLASLSLKLSSEAAKKSSIAKSNNEHDFLNRSLMNSDSINKRHLE